MTVLLLTRPGLPIERLVRTSIDVAPVITIGGPIGGNAGPVDMFNNNGILVLISGSGYPISPVDLPAGYFWNNGLAIAVVPGGTPMPGFQVPIFFPGVTALQLLQHGGANLPSITDDDLLPQQICLDNGLVAVFPE